MRVFLVATNDPLVDNGEIQKAVESVVVQNPHYDLSMFDTIAVDPYVSVSELQGTYTMTADAITHQPDATGGIKQKVTILVPSVQRAVNDLTEAIRYTVEYVGTQLLPPIEGWSWYDALVKYAPEKAVHFKNGYDQTDLDL